MTCNRWPILAPLIEFNRLGTVGLAHFHLKLSFKPEPGKKEVGISVADVFSLKYFIQALQQERRRLKGGQGRKKIFNHPAGRSLVQPTAKASKYKLLL